MAPYESVRFHGVVVCLAVLAWPSSVCNAMRSSASIVRHFAQPSFELHHAGHAASHVTRLHRYDHSGMDVFLEREEAWSQPLEEGELHQRSLATDLASYVQLSNAQVETLWDHQHATIHHHTASRRQRGVGHVALASFQEHNERGLNMGLMAALQQQSKLQNSVSHGRAVTGLSSLSSQYVGPIGVGTTLPSGCDMPSKDCQATVESQLWVVFDSGSTNLWVSSDLCTEGPCAKPDRKRYNHTRSLTHTDPADASHLTVHFGTGMLKGPMAVDDLHIGPFTVYNQTFEMIEEEEGSVFESTPFEGILGLAFPAMSAKNKKPFFDTVIEQKGLENNEFAVYFSKDNPMANAVFWGGVDQSFFTGKIEYYKVTDPYYWSIDLAAFRIGSECLRGPGCSKDLATRGDEEADSAETEPERLHAIVDTGTTYFTAEGGLFAEIMDRLPAGRCADMTDKTHPAIIYTMTNMAGIKRDFVFTRDMYMTIRGEGAGAKCSPAFMEINVPRQHGPAMLFGEVFLRYFYAVFDRGQGADNDARVGFAPAVHSGEAHNQLRQLTQKQASFKDTRRGL